MCVFEQFHLQRLYSQSGDERDRDVCVGCKLERRKKEWDYNGEEKKVKMKKKKKKMMMMMIVVES